MILAYGALEKCPLLWPLALEREQIALYYSLTCAAVGVGFCIGFGFSHGVDLSFGLGFCHCLGLSWC